MRNTFRSKLLMVLTFVLALFITTPVAAQGILIGATIPAGQVVDQDVVLIGQNIALDGTVNGNVFILGNQVTINGTVDGSLILIGQNATIGGTIQGGIYTAALTLDLAAHAWVERDLYVAAVSLTSGTGSVIGRDLYALGLDSGLSGHVGRQLHTVIGPIQLYNGLMHLLGFDDLKIKLHIETPGAASPGSGLVPGGGHARLLPSLKPAARFDWNLWAVDLLRNWVVLSLFGLLSLWLLRKPLGKAGEPLRLHPLQTLGTGLLVLVIAFALVGVALLLAVLAFTIGLGLIYLGVWPLAIIFWVASFACLALALIALWLLIVYGAKIIVVYLAAGWVLGKIFRRQAVWLDILAILAGSVVYLLLRSIPFLGWMIGVLVTAAGVGSAWLAYRESRRKLPVPASTETAGRSKKLAAKISA